MPEVAGQSVFAVALLLAGYVLPRAVFGGIFGVQGGAMYYRRTGGSRDSDGPFRDDADDDEEQFSDRFRPLDRMHILRVPVLGVARFAVQNGIWITPQARAMVDFLIAWEGAGGFADQVDELRIIYNRGHLSAAEL